MYARTDVQPPSADIGGHPRTHEEEEEDEHTHTHTHTHTRGGDVMLYTQRHAHPLYALVVCK